MARTYIQPGNVVTLTAPSGGVVAGTPKLIGSQFVIPQNTVAETLPFEAMLTGVHQLNKTSAQAWTEGQAIYWNTGTNLADNVANTGPLIGAAEAVAANPTSTGIVRLNGTVPSSAEGPQASIADMVAISGGEAPTEAEHNLVITKINAILATLRIYGVILAP